MTGKERLGEYVKNLARRVMGREEEVHSALTVSHAEALAWFQRRSTENLKLVEAVLPYIQDDAVIFDVGANIGYFSLLLARKRPSFSGSIYLFEPLPHLADLCRKTFQDLPLDTTVLGFGLSDEDGEEDMFVAGNGNLGWNTLVAEMTSPDMTRVRIQLRAFDRCGIDVTPSFIKIDVEGAEHRVLSGMLGSLARWQPKPVVLCEVGWGQAHPRWQEEAAIFARLHGLGYTVCSLDGAPLDTGSLQGTTDVLLLPANA